MEIRGRGPLEIRRRRSASEYWRRARRRKNTPEGFVVTLIGGTGRIISEGLGCEGGRGLAEGRGGPVERGPRVGGKRIEGAPGPPKRWSAVGGISAVVRFSVNFGMIVHTLEFGSCGNISFLKKNEENNN